MRSHRLLFRPRSTFAPSSLYTFPNRWRPRPPYSGTPIRHASNAAKEGFAAFRPLTRPFIKVFLGALFTYQVVYWAWLKLETDELKLQKNKEIAALEQSARQLTSRQK
ncbi:hypothetical protein V8E54_000482 [Elaphomyces granulatus]